MPKSAAAEQPPEPDTPAPEQAPATEAAAPDLPEAAAASPGPDAGGWFVNVAAVALTIPHPPTELGPGRVVELPYTPTHRDLKPATPADIEASRAAEEAEAAAAAAPTGQEA